MGEAAYSGLHQWVHSLSIMLGCVDHKKVEACSITLVPEQLRRSKEEAYTPRVVSVGPLHKVKRTDLLYMEEIKLRCMLYLLHRLKDDIKELDQVLLNCGKAMLDSDELVRASYNVDDLKLNRDDLAKIMVLDGCFLLELLISGSTELNKKLESRLAGPSSGIEVIQREKVLSDLIMLENQIPLIVLGKLFTTLFPKYFRKGDNDGIIGLIHEHALSILGYDYSTLGSPYSSELKGFHFLELVHSFIDKEKAKDKATKQNANAAVENNEVNNALSIGIPSEKVANTSHGERKLLRCATRLEAAGVKIKPPEAPGKAVVNIEGKRASETRFDLKITFSNKNGILVIPQLHITETAEAKWRSLIAWEVNRITLEKQRGKQARFSCQFIFYAWFFQSLICSVHDLKLLRDRNVIVVHESMSNEDLMNMLRNITEGVPDAEIDMDSWFCQVIDKLNSYPITVDGARKTRKVLWHIFRCVLTWIWYKCRGAYGLLRRDYIPSGWGLIAVLAAATGLALTATQTHYSIHNN